MNAHRLPGFLLLAPLFASLAVAADDPSPPDSKPISAALQPFVERHILAGAVALVADRNRVLTLESVGYADVAARMPMHTDALFWIASQSKPITATALMILEDEGKVSLDDPVEKYLPEFKDQWLAVERDVKHMTLRKPGRPIQLRDLLSHRSGLVHFLELEDPASPTFEILPLREATRLYALTPLQFEPGSKWRYSNAGFNTLGRIIEVSGGTPYDEFLERRIFVPLGMTDTTFSPGKEQLARLARSYKPGADRRGSSRRRSRYSRGLRMAASSGPFPPAACSRPPPTSRVSARCCSTAGRSVAGASSPKPP